MKVLVDTSVWSLVLRRHLGHLNAEEARLRGSLEELIRDGRVLIIGPVRQEILSGIRERAQFEHVRDSLRAFPDTLLARENFESAAWMSNQCAARGIANGAVDMLLCSVAHNTNSPIFTTDQDFLRYAKILPIRLFQPQIT